MDIGSLNSKSVEGSMENKAGKHTKWKSYQRERIVIVQPQAQSYQFTHSN